jgi:hypothetical protein
MELAYKGRVVTEKAELDDKLIRLRAFLSRYDEACDQLPDDEKQRLAEQEGYMAAYSDVLRRRIEAF